MKINVKIDYTVKDLIDLKKKQLLKVNQEYQRGLRWRVLQRQMFIDSILRGYSTHAFFFHKKKTLARNILNTHFDIVDGQQRIDALSRYCDGEFSLLDPSGNTGFRFPNFIHDHPCEWGCLRFRELPKNLKSKLMNHKMVVYEITTNNENEIRDLFIRLQGGTPLTPQDKRDSWPGNFTDFILKIGGKHGEEQWPGDPLFKEVAKVRNNESKRRQLAAQVYILFLSVRKNKEFCDINSAKLDEFYHSNVNFDEESIEARRFKKICKIISDAMNQKPRLVGHFIIHLFLFVDSLIDEYAGGWEDNLAEKLFEFERRLKKAEEDMKNRRDSEFKNYYSEYVQLTRTSSDKEDTICRRHAFFSEKMLEFLSPKRRDKTRSFTDLQRQIVFFRDKGFCQWCRMNGKSHKVPWDECEVHHVVPHSEGGRTEVSNGALVHKDCHPIRENDVKRFKKWWYRTDEIEIKRKFPPDGTKCKCKYRGELYEGEIINGTLELDASSGGGEFTSFSGASRRIRGYQSNGWTDWEILLPDENNWLKANEWRNRN